MSSAHTDPNDIIEHVESSTALDSKVATLAHWIRDARHCIFFTGAGISTSVGIQDFRGPTGLWTLQAQGKLAKKGSTVCMGKAFPSPTHLALVALHRAGLTECVVSQNLDGLHRKSGIPSSKLAELHGCTNLERCPKCGKEYLRDFRARNQLAVHEHGTGRLCEDAKCQTELQDTIVNFEESLPERDLGLALAHANEADLCIVLGSSLTVQPAASIPERVAERGGRLVIVNLQRTPLDSKADLRIFAKTDDIMSEVLGRLGLAMPVWSLERIVIVGHTDDKRGKRTVTLRSIDTEGTPYSVCQSVDVKILDGTRTAFRRADREPFAIELPSPPRGGAQRIQIRLNFRGHHKEPTLSIEHVLSAKARSEQAYRILYRPRKREQDKRWMVTRVALRRDPAGGVEVAPEDGDARHASSGEARVSRFRSSTEVRSGCATDGARLGDASSSPDCKCSA